MNLVENIPPAKAEKLVSLAVPANEWVITEEYEPTTSIEMSKILRHLPSLKELLVVGTIREPRSSLPGHRTRSTSKIQRDLTSASLQYLEVEHTTSGGLAFTQVPSQHEHFEEELDTGDLVPVYKVRELAMTYLDEIENRESMEVSNSF